MRELVGASGWFTGAQGVLGIVGHVHRGEPWGVLRHGWVLPTPGYAVLAVAVAVAVAGAALALYGETGKRGRAGAD
ncbi:hypothetical protein [Streptomyces sp. enrichment culture]|uniref:hypothetical protein n=1 Tax=Streptomyces sp. enrichment culture TaxID=1795815 RepID=UPI003F557556